MIRDKNHIYVRIKIELVEGGKVTLFQKDHLLDGIEDFREDMSSSMSSLAQKGLFGLNEYDKSLSEERSATFHSVVQKLLVLGKRSRPDLQPTVYFLCTHVQLFNALD